MSTIQKIALFLPLTLVYFSSMSQTWDFFPIQTVTKFNDGTLNWNYVDNRSVKTDYAYQNGKIASTTIQLWYGAFETNNYCTRMEYVYSGNNIDYTILKFWNGTNYVLTENSIKTEYAYNGNGQIDYTITKYWDSVNSTWYLGYQWIGYISTKTEYNYVGSALDYTINKFYDGQNWFIGYQSTDMMSTKTEYTYSGNMLDYTIVKYYNGTGWYIGYQWIYDQSVKTEYYYTGNTLDYTLTKYYDGSQWYIGYQFISSLSTKTEYLFSSASIDESQNLHKIIKISPNPIRKSAELFSESMLNHSRIEIRNLTGALMLAMDNVSGGSVSINCEQLCSGMYILLLVQDGQTHSSQKIVIEN